MPLPTVPLANVQQQSLFYTNAGMGRFVPELKALLTHSPYFNTPSDEFVKYSWHYSSFVGRLLPCPVGSGKYTLSKTKRIQNVELISVLENLGFAYSNAWSAAQANYSAAYLNKFRFDREPFPESFLPEKWQALYPISFEKMCSRYRTSLEGSVPYTVEQVLAELDLNKSCGFPWKLRFHSKKEFLTKTPDWDPMSVLENFNTSLDSESTLFYSFWMDKLKDEIRPNEKLAANKIRTFNISPIEVVVADNMYGLNFNQNFYVAGSSLNNWTTVGATKYYGNWDKMIRKHLRIGSCHSLSADGGQFDSRLSAVMLFYCAQIRCKFTKLDERQRRRVQNLYRLSIFRLCYGELGDLIWLFIGNASGRAHTIVDNTLVHSMYWCLVWEILFETFPEEFENTQRCQDEHLCLSICGDDLLMSVSDRLWPFFTPVITSSLMLRLGMSMEFETLERRHVSECVYLSHTSEFQFGLWLPSPHYDRVFAGLVEAADADDDSHTVDPRWTLLRLYAIRVETWGNSRLRDHLAQIISYYLVKHRELFTFTQDDYVVRSGVSWKQVSTVYKSDSELRVLYTGQEGGARNFEFPFIFEKSSMTEAMREVFLFDSTMGYPGEGPPKQPEVVKLLSDNCHADRATFEDRVYTLGGRRQRHRVRTDPDNSSNRRTVVRDRLRSRFDKTKGYEGEGPKLSDLRFKFHGNWGGPNYGGGEFGRNPDWNVPSVDALDESFKKHDFNYTRMPEKDADRLWLQHAKDVPASLKKQLAQIGFHFKGAKLEDFVPRMSRLEVEDPGDYPWEKKTIRYGEAENPGPPKRSQKGKAKNSVKRSQKSKKKQVRIAKKAVRSAIKKVYPKMVKSRFSVAKGVVQPGFFSSPLRAKVIRSNIGSTRIQGTVLAFVLGGVDIEQFASVWGNGADPFFDLNPYSVAGVASDFTENSPIVAACDYKKRWRGKITVKYEKMCPVTTTGGMVAFCDMDAADSETSALGTRGILSVAANHQQKRGQRSEVFQPFMTQTWTFSTSKAMWLRQATGADIRSTSLGKFYMVAATQLQGNTLMTTYGNVYIDYDIELLDNSSNERQYYAEFLGNTSMSSGVGEVNPTQGDWMNPRSEVVQPSSVSPVKTFSGVHAPNEGVNMCVNNTAPVAQYVESNIVLTPANALASSNPVVIKAWLNGVDATSTLLSNNYVVNAGTSGCARSDTVLVPAGTTPGSIQLTCNLSSSSTLASTTEFDWFMTPSVFFDSDFVGMSRDERNLHVRHVMNRYKGAVPKRHNVCDISEDRLFEEFKLSGEAQELLKERFGEHQLLSAVSNPSELSDPIFVEQEESKTFSPSIRHDIGVIKPKPKAASLF